MLECYTFEAVEGHIRERMFRRNTVSPYKDVGINLAHLPGGFSYIDGFFCPLLGVGVMGNGWGMNSLAYHHCES